MAGVLPLFFCRVSQLILKISVDLMFPKLGWQPNDRIVKSFSAPSWLVLASEINWKSNYQLTKARSSSVCQCIFVVNTFPCLVYVIFSPLRLVTFWMLELNWFWQTLFSLYSTIFNWSITFCRCNNKITSMNSSWINLLHHCFSSLEMDRFLANLIENQKPSSNGNAPRHCLFCFVCFVCFEWMHNITPETGKWKGLYPMRKLVLGILNNVCMGSNNLHSI